MRDLIRQILREYTEPKVTIYQISEDSPILKNILNEQGGGNNVFYDNEGNVVNISSVARELKFFFESRYNFPKEKSNVFCGRYNSKGCGIKFILNKTNPFNNNHFVERIYRVTSGDYRPDGYKYDEKLVNPGKFEGLELFFDNIDFVVEKITDSSVSIKGGRNPWQTNTSKSFYMLQLENLFSIMFELEKYDMKTIGTVYIVKFLTQLKGDEMNKTTKLHNSIKIIV